MGESIIPCTSRFSFFALIREFSSLTIYGFYLQAAISWFTLFKESKPLIKKKAVGMASKLTIKNHNGVTKK
jgi:hypothetical protein